MLEFLRAWLNGKKDYNSGVILYNQLGDNAALKKLLLHGPTDYNRARLQKELLQICNELKSKQNDSVIPAAPHSARADTASVRPESKLPQDSLRRDTYNEVPSEKQQSEPVNHELYDATKLQADKLYKSVMNDRAVLFSLANSIDHTDPNTEVRISGRAKLALSVVTGFQQASALYEKAQYVKEHGRLPCEDNTSEENEYDHLPEHLVKQTLDNLRKNLGKMKKREQTPERIALQQKHESNIEKLSKKWHSLKF